jgi:hypothetical protein
LATDAYGFRGCGIQHPFGLIYTKMPGTGVGQACWPARLASSASMAAMCARIGVCAGAPGLDKARAASRGMGTAVSRCASLAAAAAHTV